MIKGQHKFYNNASNKGRENTGKLWYIMPILDSYLEFL